MTANHGGGKISAAEPAWMSCRSLFNVLSREMSLVGPRPAIPYELAAYQTWHRRRVLETKPGITGVWQVTGRSRVKFDEMVRMDLRYAWLGRRGLT